MHNLGPVHEITGEIIEVGSDVVTLKKGDLVSVPFNVACGRCPMCKGQNTGVCLTVNPSRAGGAYGYVDMGGWIGGQAEYVMIPYADFNLLKFPDRDRAMAKIRDLTCLSDILPTGYHGAVTAGVGPGSTVYIAGAGPVGLAAAAAARLLGAAVTIIGDVNPKRLEHARHVGFETVDLSQDASLADQIAALLGEPEVDCAIDCVGFEARGHGHAGTQHEAPATVLNSLMEVTRAAGKIGIPGLYVTDDPGALDSAAKHGSLSVRFGLGWAKSHSFFTGQTPVMKYNRNLMQAILFDRLNIAEVVNVTVIELDQAPSGYAEFDSGVPKKCVIDPHGSLKAAA
ncbi:MAG TPA: alcohol dehydrogenase catalytic domain-containing protein [Trinickia sp.]